MAPPALMAATPVGAATTAFLLVLSFMYLRKVVFPVPALPVRKICREVLATNSVARIKSSLLVSGVKNATLLLKYKVVVFGRFPSEVKYQTNFVARNF